MKCTKCNGIGTYSIPHHPKVQCHMCDGSGIVEDKKENPYTMLAEHERKVKEWIRKESAEITKKIKKELCGEFKDKLVKPMRGRPSEMIFVDEDQLLKQKPHPLDDMIEDIEKHLIQFHESGAVKLNNAFKKLRYESIKWALGVSTDTELRNHGHEEWII